MNQYIDEKDQPLRPYLLHIVPVLLSGTISRLGYSQVIQDIDGDKSIRSSIIYVIFIFGVVPVVGRAKWIT